MASRRADRRRRCGHKRRFPNQTAAVAAIIALRRSTGHRLHSYVCPYCGFFHIGHGPDSYGLL